MNESCYVDVSHMLKVWAFVCRWASENPDAFAALVAAIAATSTELKRLDAERMPF